MNLQNMVRFYYYLAMICNLYAVKKKNVVLQSCRPQKHSRKDLHSFGQSFKVTYLHSIAFFEVRFVVHIFLH